MPIYEYRCENCGHEMEAIQKLSDDPLKACPACATDSLKKKISAAGFRLKGGGWYETDFKSGTKRNVSGSGGESSGEKSSSDGASSSSDAKSESSAPKKTEKAGESKKASSD